MTLFELSFWWIHIMATWYWLMYAIGFLACYTYIKRYGEIAEHDMDNFLLFLFIGVIFGGRIGYALFYNFSYFASEPLALLAIWKWGMSFHGGTIWVILALIIFSRRYHYSLYTLSDSLVSILPLALGLGRIGNYLNRELLGYFPYDWPFAVMQNGISYFPSPLLQAFLEWVVLLAIMQSYRYYEFQYGHISWYMSAFFLIGYGCIRIFAELFRLPDAHIGYLFGTHWMTLGMIYSLPMILWGIILFFSIRRWNKNAKT